MITLFGATGFTGRLIAAELAKTSQPFRLAGRSPEKLRALSNSLPAKPDWIIADAAQVSSLPALFKDSQVLINCAGPFTDLGERVIAQAAMSGSAYLDISNELGFVYRAQGYHAMAKRTGALLVPACGFEVALADCMAHILADQVQPDTTIDEINVIYQLSGAGASAGTRRSIVRSLATSWIAYRQGEWKGEIPGARLRKFELPAGARHTQSMPSCESLSIPSHTHVNTVNVWLAAKPSTLLFSRFTIPLLARLSRSIARPLLLKLASQGGHKPDDQNLMIDAPDDGFVIYVGFRHENRDSWMSLNGSNPYGLTAKIIALAAATLPERQKCGLVGILAPAQALNPSGLLSAAVTEWGLTISPRLADES